MVSDVLLKNPITIPGLRFCNLKENEFRQEFQICGI